MISEKIEIKVKTGLHARPASQLVTLIKGFQSKFIIRSNNKTANGASIISILALGLKYGSEVEIEANGEDEAGALKEVVAFIENLED
jgi:phosphocarrier protein HPr